MISVLVPGFWRSAIASEGSMPSSAARQGLPLKASAMSCQRAALPAGVSGGSNRNQVIELAGCDYLLQLPAHRARLASNDDDRPGPYHPIEHRRLPFAVRKIDACSPEVREPLSGLADCDERAKARELAGNRLLEPDPTKAPEQEAGQQAPALDGLLIVLERAQEHDRCTLVCFQQSCSVRARELAAHLEQERRQRQREKAQERRVPRQFLSSRVRQSLA